MKRSDSRFRRQAGIRGDSSLATDLCAIEQDINFRKITVRFGPRRFKNSRRTRMAFTPFMLSTR